MFLFFYSVSLFAQDIKNLVINPNGSGKVYCCEFNKACVNPTAWTSYSGGLIITKEKQVLLYTEGKKKETPNNDSYSYTIIVLSQKLINGCSYSLKLHLPKNKKTVVYYALSDSIHTMFSDNDRTWINNIKIDSAYMKGKSLTITFAAGAPNLQFLLFKIVDKNVAVSYRQLFGKIEVVPITCTHKLDYETTLYINKIKTDTRRHFFYLPCKNTTY